MRLKYCDLAGNKRTFSKQFQDSFRLLEQLGIVFIGGCHFLLCVSEVGYVLILLLTLFYFSYDKINWPTKSKLTSS